MNIRKACGAFALAAVMLLGVASPAVQWRSVGAAPKSISYESLTDKLEGGWMGALWANFTGLPSEFQYIGSPGADSQFEWVVSDVYCTDDDTSMEYTFLHMMEVYGANDITYADMPAEWIYHFQDYIWEGNYNARQLMLQGVLPPETGKAGFNATPEAIDAQIECEIFGMITPGMLENAYGRTLFMQCFVQVLFSVTIYMPLWMRYAPISLIRRKLRRYTTVYCRYIRVNLIGVRHGNICTACIGTGILWIAA